VKLQPYLITSAGAAAMLGPMNQLPFFRMVVSILEPDEMKAGEKLPGRNEVRNRLEGAGLLVPGEPCPWKLAAKYMRTHLIADIVANKGTVLNHDIQPRRPRKGMPVRSPCA